ncbi:MAG: alpha-L-fucosidase [Candidatus Hydrogenedentes bacterium]|nr:alpha-L-fucosidase [Candidatus Hydrogenedentota bacterium]
MMIAGLFVLLATTAQADAQPKWPADAFFGLHYDLHPGPQDTELGRETTYEHIRAMLEKVKPDYVQYDCKGHPGWTGYPSKVGSPSPGIVNDALAVWRKVTKDMGIPLSIHYSGVWDTRAIELHPEWANINAEGKPNPNNTDPLSDYTEKFMIPQLIEVVDNYDIDGVWIDGENWASQPSWSERCIAEFTKRTGISEVPRKPGDPHWAEWLAFQRTLFVEHVQKYAEALHKRKPSIAVCSNWMYSVRQPEPIAAPVDYLSGDFDPSFGAERSCAESRFLAARGLPWNLMAWAFLKTGDGQWTFKPAPHMCQELAVTLAQGGSVFIYDQPQRSGRLTEWHQDIYAEVAEFCRARKEYCFKTQTIPQVAILHSESFYYRHNDPLFNFRDANHPMEGALHAMLENGYSVDILNEEMLLERIAHYPMVVVPEQEELPQEVVEALRRYVSDGGQLLLSGQTAVKEFGDITGATPKEDALVGNSFVPAGNGCVAVNGPWQSVSLTSATELAPLLNQQEPALNRVGVPAAIVNNFGKGRVVTVTGPAFRAYHHTHYPLLRRFLGDAANALVTTKLAHVSGPWWIEMSARQKDGRLLIQFVNRASAGYTAPNRHVVEDVPNSGPFTVTIPVDKRPKRVFMGPEKAGCEWTWSNGMLTAKIAGLGIHNVLVVEHGD